MDEFSAHKANEASQADKLGADGAKLGLKVLSASTMAFAQGAAAKAAGDKSRAPLNEGASDLMDVRSSSRFTKALDNDLVASQESVTEALLVAMETGLDEEMVWQAQQFKGMKWDMNDSDRELLHSYPIQGHTAFEMSQYMHNQIRYEVNGTVAAPLDGSSPIDSVPEALGTVVQRFSDRVSKAVMEAYFAGVQLGVRMAAEAVSHVH